MNVHLIDLKPNLNLQSKYILVAYIFVKWGKGLSDIDTTIFADVMDGLILHTHFYIHTNHDAQNLWNVLICRNVRFSNYTGAGICVACLL